MSEVNLPHDHGQNIEKVLERMPDTDECVVVAEVFKQISDGSRIRILWLLCHCEECVSNIAAAMNMSASVCSAIWRMPLSGTSKPTAASG